MTTIGGSHHHHDHHHHGNFALRQALDELDKQLKDDLRDQHLGNDTLSWVRPGGGASGNSTLFGSDAGHGGDDTIFGVRDRLTVPGGLGGDSVGSGGQFNFSAASVHGSHLGSSFIGTTGADTQSVGGGLSPFGHGLDTVPGSGLGSQNAISLSNGTKIFLGTPGITVGGGHH